MTHDARSESVAIDESVLVREAAWLVPYATHSADSAGRRHHEILDPQRGPYEIDRERIVHSAAFRRLGCKTQVFTRETGDYHRTRLTHTMEVCSVARRVGRAMRLNEDLIEALALAHDLGHPPFGHAGEAELDRCLAEAGGFCHNRQALRLVEELERCDHRFVGLNLSQEVLDGQGTRSGNDGRKPSARLEVQVVDAADSVAYDTHDPDDALEVGLLSLDELLEVPLWREAARRVQQRAANLSPRELQAAVRQELLDWQIDDLIQQARLRLAEGDLTTSDAARTVTPLVVPSAEIAEQKVQFERFMFQRVYRHPQVLDVRQQAQNCLRSLFDWLQECPEQMPPRFYRRIVNHGLSRTIGDYLAGMTDRYAWQRHEQLAAGRV